MSVAKQLRERIKLRDATLDDVPLVEYWDTKQHVIDCDPDGDWNWKQELGRSPEWRRQLVAELDQRPIGFVQIIDPFEEESRYWGDVAENKRAIDIWIGEEQDLNQGYGAVMMRLAIEQCLSDPKVDGILIDPLKSNTKAHRFYKRLGFEFVEERDFDGAACFVFELRRTPGDD